MISENKVSYYKADSYREEEIIECVRKIFEDIDADELLRNAKKIVIKPNLVIRRGPDACSTTHPMMLTAVMKALEKYDARKIIVESPGGFFNEAILKGLYKTTGFEDAAKKSGCELNFDVEAITIPSKRHGVISEFNVLREFEGADVIINLCKLKTHTLTTMSGASKNMYGAIPGLQKFELHARFPEIERFSAMVLELTETLSPKINIVDAVYGMEGNGPNNGEARFFGGVFGSRSPFVCDVVCRDYLGLPEDSVEMLDVANEMGLCPKNIGEIELLGDVEEYEKRKLKDLKMPDTKKPNIITTLTQGFGGRFRKFLESRPVAMKDCKGCGKCADFCPAKAITIVKGKAKIDRDTCIKCYCCQELCPFGLMGIKRFGIFDL